MKNIFYSIFSLLTVLIFSCNNGNNIIGKWVHISKNKQDTTIMSVVKEKDLYVGRLIQVSPNMNFEIDEIIWKDIEFIEKGKYKYKNAYRYPQKKIFYEEEYFEVKNDSLFIKTENKNIIIFKKNKN